MGPLINIIMAAGRALGSAATVAIQMAKNVSKGVSQVKLHAGLLSQLSNKMKFSLPSLDEMTNGLNAAKEIAASIVMPGFDYAKDIERSKQGIAAVLQSMTTLNGETMSFSNALGITDNIMKKLEADAINTSSTTEELAASFQQLLAPGLGAGMDLGQIEALTSQSMSAGKALGMDGSAIVKEMQGIMGGNVQGSKLAEMMGIMPEDIEAAKQSSEGLFSYLEERFTVFGDVTQNYQETLAGKLSKLEEIGVIASSKFTEAFEPEIKECLDFVTDMIGQVNEETGEVEINPAIMGFIGDLKAGWQELTSYISDILGDNEETVDNCIDMMGSLYHTVGNLGQAFLDFMRIIYKLTAMEMISGILAGIAEAMEYLTGKLRNFLDMAARALNLKHNDGAPSQRGVLGKKLRGFRTESEEKQNLNESLMAGQADRETRQAENEARQAEEKRRRDDEAARREAEKREQERIRASQENMKAMLQYWKEQLDDIKRNFDDGQDAVKFRFEQGKISSDDYYTGKAQREAAFNQEKINNIDKRIAEVEGASFADEAERERMLRGLNEERRLTANEQEMLLGAYQEMQNALALQKEGKLSADKEFNFREASAAVEAYQKALEPAAEILRQYNELNGDISSDKLKELGEQRAAMKRKFFLYTDDKIAAEAAEKVDIVIDNQEIQVKFDQVKKNMAKANDTLAEAEQKIFSDLIQNKISVGEADGKLGELYEHTFSEYQKALEELLKSPNITVAAAQSIKQELAKTQNTINTGFGGIFKAIDEKLQTELAAINADSNLTRRQKQYVSERATRQSYREKANATRDTIGHLQGLSPVGRRKYETDHQESVDDAIVRNQGDLSRFNELSKIPPLLDDIARAGKQAFEDGLFSFLSSGINECKNLGEAFRNLGKSILQSIQQVVADRLTKEFMGLFLRGFSGGGNVEGGGLPGAATGGKIVGRGTGTSDSILAWLSNGEYVVKAESVKRFGTNFLDHINNGMIPPEIYQWQPAGNLVGQGAAAYSATNSVNVPVNVSGFGNPAMTSELRSNIEDTVVKIIRKYS